MSIRGNVGFPAIPLSTGDTVLYEVSLPIERIAVSALSVFNDGITTNVNIYSSPNLTSASGTKIGSVTVGTDKAVDLVSVIGQGFKVGENLIATAGTSDVNASITVVEYDSGS